MHRFVSTNASVVWNVTLDILTPDDRMFSVGPEESRNICSSRINGIKLPLAEYTGEMLLNGCDSGRSKVVTENPERRDGL